MIRSALLKFRFSISQWNANKDYYKILGVQKNATEGDIKKAFFKLAKKYHPDMSKGNKSHEAIFKDANQAYSVLSDQKLKGQYDSATSMRSSFGGSYNPFSGSSQQQSYNNYNNQSQQQRYRWTQQTTNNKPNWNNPDFQQDILNQLFRMHNQARNRGGGGNPNMRNQQQFDFARQAMNQFIRQRDDMKRASQEDYMRRFEEEMRRSYEERERRTREINQKFDKVANTVKEGVVGVVSGIADLAEKAKRWWNSRK